MSNEVEKHRKRAREYYHKNKDKINKQRKENRKTPEARRYMREYMRKYYKKKREEKTKK